MENGHWFTDIALVEQPGIDELKGFILGVKKFLDDVFKSEEFDFMWEINSELKKLARETFDEDLKLFFTNINEVVGTIEEPRLIANGLKDRPLRFKLNVVDSLANHLTEVPEERSEFFNWLKSEWLAKILDAISPVIESILDAIAKEIQEKLGDIFIEFIKIIRSLLPQLPLRADLKRYFQ